MNDYYRYDKNPDLKKPKQRRRRRFLFLLLLLLLLIGFFVIRGLLSKPETSVTQSKAKVSKVAYEAKTKHYDEPDFGIDIPITWEPQKPPYPSSIYMWGTSENGTNGQNITVYQDSIPPNFAVNRVMIVTGEGDHVNVQGAASENCISYTKSAAINHIGAPAKWQDVDFLCDQANRQRDVVGTSSTDGINTVILKTSLGVSHKFFFTYTSNSLSPDLGAFQAAVESLRMQ